jgi:hypothetical protein
MQDELAPVPFERPEISITYTHVMIDEGDVDYGKLLAA